MSRRPTPPLVTLLAAVLALTTTLAACGGAALPAPSREAKTEFVEMRRNEALPASAAAQARGVDEADFSGTGVAGGAASAPAARPMTGPESAAAAPAVPFAVQPSASNAAPSGTAPSGAGEGEGVAAPMLIRTGSAAVEVDSLEPAIAQVRALAARVGGYVANTSLAAGREQVRSATLELRVPAARFDELVGGLAPFGRVERVDVQAQDVGEEFVDLSARTANARRLEARLVELLARRTGKLEEVLAVERELARVREEIERYDGRLRYLRTRAATSTLAVTVHEPAPLLADAPGANPVTDAIRAAGRNFVALVAAVIATSGVWAPLGGIAYGAWRWLRRHRAAAVRRRGAAPASPAAPSAA